MPIATIEKVVEQYTNESGVRGLEKKVAKIVRNRAKEMAMEEPYTVEVTHDNLKDILEDLGKKIDTKTTTLPV